MTTTPATRTPSLDGSNITSSKERDNDVHLVSSSRASTAAEPPHHHGPGLSKGRQIGIIVACTLTMMNNMGNGPSFTVTLPDLAKDLNITAANIQWVISAYSLTAVCILFPSQSTTFPFASSTGVHARGVCGFDLSVKNFIWIVSFLTFILSLLYPTSR